MRRGSDDKQVVYDVETLRQKRVEETLPAIFNVIAKTEGNARQDQCTDYTEIELKS